jgi:integrase/recombinase XerC
LLTKFLASRRQGISPHTIAFYRTCLNRLVENYELTPEAINAFLGDLTCSTGGKHSYYRAIRAFCNWLERNDYIRDNPLNRVDPPKPRKPILPSLTEQQVQHLIDKANTLRDKCIISLFADSGMRLNELLNITGGDVCWDNHTITIWGKGNKQRKAPFTERSAKLLREWIPCSGNGSNLWGLTRRGIQTILLKLEQQTGLKCNPHTFRRTFACNLHRKGLSTLDIMHLGGWSDLSMVLRYTRSITFEDCLEHYRKVTNN